MSKKRNPINLFGVKLKQGREARGLSQEEVAIKLADFGITVRDINDWESGFEIPDEEKIQELANLYEISYSELIQIKNDTEVAQIAKNRMHRKKFVGRTFWDIFGDFIIKTIELIVVVGIIFIIVKTGVVQKLWNMNESNNVQDENYIVDDEYLRMLNSKNGRNGMKNKNIEE